MGRGSPSKAVAGPCYAWDGHVCLHEQLIQPFTHQPCRYVRFHKQGESTLLPAKETMLRQRHQQLLQQQQQQQPAQASLPAGPQLPAPSTGSVYGRH